MINITTLLTGTSTTPPSTPQEKVASAIHTLIPSCTSVGLTSLSKVVLDIVQADGGMSMATPFGVPIADTLIDVRYPSRNTVELFREYCALHLKKVKGHWYLSTTPFTAHTALTSYLKV